MESNRSASARRWSAVASVVLVAGAVLVAVIASGAASAQTEENTSPPTISGNAVVGQTLTATAGTWSGATTGFTYDWFRCDTSGANCNTAGAPIGSGQVYQVASADVGHTLRVRVTAAGSGGGQAVSGQTAVVAASSGPVHTSDPVVTGSAVEGQTLTTTSGGWSSSSPIAFTYQWVRCGTDGGAPDGSNCPAVSGATGQTYKLGHDDVGHRLRAQVTAKNSDGSTLAASNPTAVVQASASGTGPAKNTKEPSISGTAQQGQTLTANGGSWSGASPITLTYQWVRCGADGGKPDGSNCAAIAGATSTTYVLGASDVGQRLRVKVTGRNSQGSATAASNATGTVQGTGPALPAGAIKLPNGKYSIPASSVSLPARLVIDGISFRPNPVRSRRTTIELRVHVVDTRGFYVRDVLVFGRSTPLVTSAAGEQRTGQDGWATLRMTPQRDFPLRRSYSVQFFVRARKQGDNLLAGVSTRRLVQVRTAR
jgi:hypothetical protein